MENQFRPSARSSRRIGNLFQFLLMMGLSVTAIYPFPAKLPLPYCVDQRLATQLLNPPISQTSSELFQTLIETSDKVYTQSSRIFDKYAARRWNSTYKNMDELHGNWSNVFMRETKNKQLPHTNIPLNELLYDTNQRFQMTMIAFENLQRSQVPPVPLYKDIFIERQKKIAEILCAVRNFMILNGMDKPHVETYVDIPANVFYKLNEYIVLKMFLIELGFFRDRISELAQQSVWTQSQ